MTQMEIDNRLNRIIPANLMDKYGYLSYLEMSELPEFSEYAGALIQAENNWFNLTD